MNKIQIVKNHIKEQNGIFCVGDTNFVPSWEKREWFGKWIWASEEKYAAYQKSPYTLFQKQKWEFSVFYFRKKWIMEQIPEKAVLYSTADSFYKVYVNGVMAGRGGVQPGGDYGNCEPLLYQFYECYDIQKLLRQGENDLTITVCHGPVVQSQICCGQSGLLADLEFDYGNKKEATGTGRDWKCLREKAYQASSMWDGRLAVFKNPYEWENASIVQQQEIFPKLFPSQIPNLVYVEKDIHNVISPFENVDHIKNGNRRITYHSHNRTITVKAGAPITFWIDYGAIYAAYVKFTVEGAPGIKMTLRMQEFPGKEERDGTTEIYILGNGANVIESLRMHSIHYIQLTLSNIYEDITIQEAKIEVSLYPALLKGSFECSTPLLNRIYQVGCRTNQICRQTCHMDSPIHQEPLGCMGDYMIESLMNYYSFADPWLTRFDIIKIAWYLEIKDYKMFHPSYCLLYIQMIYEYILYTGDKQIISMVRTAIDGVIKRFQGYLGTNGLIEYAPNYMFMDWVEEGNYNRHHPPKCMGQGYMTAMFANALDNAAMIYDLTDEYDYAQKLRSLSKDIKKAVHSQLWDKQKRLYIDGLYDKDAISSTKWLPADTPKKYYSQHMNTLVVLYDIAPEEIQQELMRTVMEDRSLSQAQPYFMHFVFQALSKTELFQEYGFSQLMRWKQLLDENASGLKEVWYGFDCDYSHAWGGTPTYQLPAKILGVIPIKPGFEEVSFQPSLPKELTWAKGVVPTPNGRITVQVERRQGNIKADIKYEGTEKIKIHRKDVSTYL